MHPAYLVDGIRVTRLEDARLLTGRGRYAADWHEAGELHGHFLRSDRAHARILAIDAAAARAVPGVHRVLIGEDAVSAGQVRPLLLMKRNGTDGAPARIPERPSLAHDRVRFVGEPVALVVADSVEIARDAAERIEVRYAELPAVVGFEAPLAPGAPQLHEDIPGNLCIETEAGDAAAVARAFAAAAHVVRLVVDSARVVPNPMEPRACLASYDAASGNYRVHVPVQGLEMMRRQLAAYTGVAPERIEVVAQDVGGGFGGRSMGYPEYCALMLAARLCARPVRWVSTRGEGLLSDTHGRSNRIAGELALDAAGRFLALRVDWISDVGAYSTPVNAVGPIGNGAMCMTGVYRIPALHGRWRVTYSNAAPVGNYRGAGRPDTAYIVERLVAQAAVELGIDPVELRRRNFISAGAFPYLTPTGTTYENADFHALLERALALADWQGFAARRERSAGRGLLRGRGLATVIEGTSAGNLPRDELALEVHADGTIEVFSNGHSQGQAHETTLAMIVAAELGIAVERVRLRQRHRAVPLTGNHTGGSRTMVGPGSLCRLAARELVARGTRHAAERLGFEPSQIEYAHGVFRSRDGGATLALEALADDHAFELTVGGSFGVTFPNDCHVAEVEIDPQTGATRIVSYVAVDDCGVVVNHMVVEGQVHGALAQGAGQVFGEKAHYDPESGQMLAASFMDYVMPRAGWLPEVRLADSPTVSNVSLLGAKGAGESGCTASLPALHEAVMDALRPLGVAPIEMPLTPARIWQAIQPRNRS